MSAALAKLENHLPRKRFGQNFLCDRDVIAQIIAAIAPRTSDVFIEIGPGKGALTYPLLEHCADIYAIEIDRTLAERLEQNTDPSKLRVHCADALTINYASLVGHQTVRVVGNLPYNIATPLLFHLASFQKNISDMYLMMQREIIERLTAQVGDKNYGRLSVMSAYCFEVYPLFDVAAEAFEPQPKVISRFARFVPKQDFVLETCQALDELVRHAFSGRRKTATNALSAFLDKETLKQLGVSPEQRASDLSIVQFLRMLEYLSNHQRS